MSIRIDLMDDRSENVLYDDIEYSVYIRRFRLSNYPSYAAPPHWHDDIEFIMVLSGSMAYNVNGEIIELKANEGIFVNTRQMHFGFSDAFMECDFICILLSPVMLCLTHGMEQNYVIPLLKHTHIPFIHLNNTKWHKDIIDGIREIHSLKDTPAAALKIQSIFAWIWALIYENTPPSNDQKMIRNNDLSLLKSMMSFIQQHFQEKVTLEQIASSAGVGQSKCCRLFSAYIHQTPNTYLNGYRLNKSAELLYTTDLNITEIAYEVGFSGSSYYAEAFRKCFGITPSDYRKRSKGIL